MKSLPQKIEAVILDMDGVLADSEPIHMKAFDIFLQIYNITTDSKFREAMIGVSIEQNVVNLQEQYVQLRILDHQELVDERNEIYLEMLRLEIIEPLIGIPDLINFCLNNEIKLALASSSDRIQIDLILENLEKNPDYKLKFENVFLSIVSGDSVKERKPAPDIYQKALKELGVAPQNAIAIEDSQAGVTSAKAAGLFCFALNTPYFDINKMVGYDVAINSIHDVVEILFEKV